jgi:hypothetical protein
LQRNHFQEKAMTCRGRVKNGVVVLDDPTALPDGTEVSVRPLTAKAKQGRKRPVTIRKGLLKLAGKAEGLPPDAARNLDHYLYGHRKR